MKRFPKLKKKYILFSFFALVLLVSFFNNELPKTYKPIFTKKINVELADSLILSRLNFFKEAIVPSRKKLRKSESFPSKISENYVMIQSEKKKENIYEQSYGRILTPNEILQVKHNLESGEYTFYYFLGEMDFQQEIEVEFNGKKLSREKSYHHYAFQEFKSSFKLDTAKVAEFTIKNLSSDTLFFASPFLMKKVTRQPKRLFWIVIDALRNDIINDSMTSIAAFMNQFAKENRYFSRAHATANETRRSTLSFLSGLNSKLISNRAYMRSDEDIREEHAFYRKKINKNASHQLSTHGFLTLSFLNNLYISNANYGYDLGFQYQFNVNLNSPDEELLSEAMLSYLNAHPSFDLFFFLNTNSSHFRYRSTFFNYLKALFAIPLNLPDSHYLYYGSVATADEMMEYIVKQLKRAGFYENSKLILHSDHGEHLKSDKAFFPQANQKGIDGLRHTKYFVPQVSYVPLFFHGFQLKEKTNKTIALTSILPTLLDAYNIPFHDDSYDSFSLKKARKRRSIYFEGNKLFAQFKDGIFYDAIRDEAFSFDEKEYYKKKDQTLNLVKNREAIQKDYLKNAKFVMNYLFVDSNLVSNEETSPIRFRSQHYYVFHCEHFPMKLKLKSKAKSLKLQRYVKGRLLDLTVEMFLENRLERAVKLDSKDAFYTMSLIKEKGLGKNTETINRELEKQLKSWGYIQ